MLNVFANELQNSIFGVSIDTEAVFAAVESLYQRIEGAYACVAMISDFGVIGFRDPHGIRPLVIGKKETSKGTKKMLQSINKVKDAGSILIKFPKKKQDLRADLPTIGLDTFKDCNKANLKGIVLKSNQNIFIDKNKCINFANKNKIFINIV